jgi:hypothetical protein
MILLASVAFAADPEVPTRATSDLPATPSAPPAAATRAVRESDPAGGNVPSGYRLAAPGAGPSVALSQGFVVGRTGGTNVTTIIGRYSRDRVSFSVGLPFAAYRVAQPSQSEPTSRQAELGNLQLDGYYLLTPDSDWKHYVGLETHFRVGNRAWSYMNKPDEVWPGAGIDAAWEARHEGDGLTLMLRGSLGIHSAAGYDPFPSLYGRIGAAFGVDKSLGDRMGLIGEAAAQTWDTSPFEITALFRADPIDGLRLRGGVVLPIFVWAGLTPADQVTGLTEVTVLADASLAF